jgi:hypothetical protein
MKCLINLLLILFLVSCSNDEPKVRTNPFDNFIFSYSAEDSAYSLKFTPNDTIFLGVYFPEHGNKYFSIIKDKQRNTLDSFLYANKLSTYDTTYIQKYLQDGIAYKFYITKDTAANWTYIYGDEGPKKLYTFANWLTSLKEQLKFYPYNKKVKFGDLRYIELPIVPPPPRLDVQ